MKIFLRPIDVALAVFFSSLRKRLPCSSAATRQPSASYDTHQHAEREGFRTDFPPEILTLADRVRGFIRETVPDVEERIYKGRFAAGYHDKRSGCFCGLWIEEKRVYLTFPKGEFLPDPEGLLKGDSKKMNYVVLRPGAAFPEDALFHLLVAALLFGAT